MIHISTLDLNFKVVFLYAKRKVISLNEFLKVVDQISGRYNSKVVFRDFVVMYAISISNAINHDDARESEYMSIIEKYDKHEQELFPRLASILIMALEREINDFLGLAFMSLDAGNKKDQYFTPLSAAKVIAELTIPNHITAPYNVCDPTCGSGVMIIANAIVLMERKINYQQVIKAEVADIDRVVLLMCYIQLSLLNIKAKCEVKDSLTNKIYETWYTPAELIM